MSPGKDVREVGEDRRVEAAGSSANAADAGMAEAIVETAFLAIGENRVGLGRLLELFLGLFVPRVAIRMVLQRELAVRALDLLIGRIPLDAQDFVIVTLAHARLRPYHR
jgi:hypothetical protein